MVTPRSLRRWAPLVVLLALFGAYLASTSRLVGRARSSVDRVTRGGTDVHEWEPVDHAVAADPARMEDAWDTINPEWRPVAPLAPGETPSRSKLTADFGNLSFVGGGSLPSERGEAGEVWLLGRRRFACTHGPIEVRQSSDDRLMQFRCRGEPGARLSVRFRAWVPTYPQRSARLALIHRLDRATSVAWGVLAGSALLTLALIARTGRARASSERLVGTLPYRSVAVRSGAPTTTAVGPWMRGLVCLTVVTNLWAGAWIRREQRSLERQRLVMSTPPPEGSAAPRFPTRGDNIIMDCRYEECGCGGA